MSEDSERTGQQFDQWSTLTKFWKDLATTMAASGADACNGGGADPPHEAARKMRDAMFGVMSKHIDEYLRSPLFLEANRRSMDAALTWRKQVNDMLTSLHHETQGMAREDLDTLLRSIGHLEVRVLTRMEQLEQRLEEITARLAQKTGAERRKKKDEGGKPHAPRSTGKSGSGQEA